MRTRRTTWLALALAALIGMSLFGAWLVRPTPKPGYASKPENSVSRAVRERILATEGWPPDVYSIENTNRKDEDGNLIVNVIYQDDLKATAPGGGKSLQFRVDPQTKRVMRTFHFQ